MVAYGLLPHLTASFNAVATAFLVIGFVCIRRGDRRNHARAMIGALTASALFLAVYLVHHATTPVTPFPADGPARAVYYTLLVTHVVLAAVAAPMVLATAARALRGRFVPHRRLARWTLPVWLYVSVTGIAVYVMLYHLYGDAP